MFIETKRYETENYKLIIYYEQLEGEDKLYGYDLTKRVFNEETCDFYYDDVDALTGISVENEDDILKAVLNNILDFGAVEFISQLLGTEVPSLVSATPFQFL